MLILASQSPIRSRLISQLGIAFMALPAVVNERELEARAAVDNASAREIARRLADAKAMSVAGAVVVGADQMLELDGAILHKPANLPEARKRLEVLSGRTHLLHTAVALVVDGELALSHVETSRLTMRRLGRLEIDGYLAAEGNATLQSAGAYRIEGPGLRLFERLEGDYFAILGLPVMPLLTALRRHVPATLEGFT